MKKTTPASAISFLVEVGGKIWAGLQSENSEVREMAKIADELTDVAGCLSTKLQRWISVKERLPEYKTAVLGYGLRHRNYPDTDPFPAEHVVYTRGEDEGWFTFWNNEYVAVTHWMPLPEPPKEDAHE